MFLLSLCQGSYVQSCCGRFSNPYLLSSMTVLLHRQEADEISGIQRPDSVFLQQVWKLYQTLRSPVVWARLEMETSGGEEEYTFISRTQVPCIIQDSIHLSKTLHSFQQEEILP